MTKPTIKPTILINNNPVELKRSLSARYPAAVFVEPAGPMYVIEEVEPEAFSKAVAELVEAVERRLLGRLCTDCRLPAVLPLAPALLDNSELVAIRTDKPYVAYSLGEQPRPELFQVQVLAALAAARAGMQTPLCIFLPETGAHQVTAYALGYLAALTAYEHGAVIAIGTGSEHVVSGVLQYAIDAGVEEPPEIHAEFPGEEPRVWRKGRRDPLPFMYGGSLPMTPTPRKLRELYGA